jgi:ABC-2 type transport system ATP-binding protein
VVDARVYEVLRQKQEKRYHMNAIPIHTEALSKRYAGQRVLALDRLSLRVQTGEIYGFLGPNGAGKSTAIRLLLDLIRPSSGHATIFGLDVRQHAVAIHRRVGFLPAEFSIWKSETGARIMRHFARLRGGVDRAYLDSLVQRLEFNPGKPVRAYSTGNRRKLGLILAMMHRPDLLILDEPTTGLDPLLQAAFIELMREARQEGRTVFLSSHMLHEVQSVCDRVGILRQGRLLAEHTVAELTQRSVRTVSLRIRGDGAALGRDLAHVAGVSDVGATENSVRVQLTGDFDPLLRALNGVYVEDLRAEYDSLESIFLSLYGGEPGERPTTAAPSRQPESVAS